MKTLRIWFGCSLGLALSIIFDWSYGFFAIMLPLFVLGKLERFNLPMLLMVVASAIGTTILATLLVELLQPYPALLIVGVGVMMLINCIAMMKPKTYLFGFTGLLVGSIVLNFASYDFFDIEDFNVNLWVITLANIAICALAFWLFPADDKDAGLSEISTPVKQDIDYIAQVALGWVVSMAAFIVFQVADLYDSLSALASIIIIIAPMTLAGSMAVAKVRIIGTGLGCIAGLAVQLTLGNWFGHGILYWLAFTIAMGPFCHWQTKGQIKSAIAFSAMSALSVPLTTAVIPEQKDAFFSILYRFSSIFISVTMTVMLIWVVHHGIRHQLLKPIGK
ncbi:DUF2955 domain-containing protein [Photobacterium alginatilyticum]|uniref:DUF2955 domain-containing protein n=1 Tax=Photobacterium alginatilyticum TaxID=1775171 RepID=A0ABW9YBS5_9GAMM|nr:DUF2955 domain-containing protein [Photobacterium alginatilyticum]NBI51241.1 DUF2955 domain-containing protein [Photobacterium alginatilyticum]